MGTRGKLRWLPLGLVTPLMVFICGQLAWVLQIPPEPVEVGSDLTADYSPWNSAFFPGLDPRILVEALRDGMGEAELDTQPAKNCLLLRAGCDASSMEAGDDPLEGETETPTVLRIANNTEPDFDQPDGMGLAVLPGQEILLDLRSTPILVSGSVEPTADFLLITTGESGDVSDTKMLQISLALRPDGPWTMVYAGGDQTHGDNAEEIPYSMGDEGAGGSQEPAASSEDGPTHPWIAVAIDVDAALSEAGLYGWMRLYTIMEASNPVVVDAIIVIAKPD